MPGIDRECKGNGATHHHACKCREAHFTEVEAKLKIAREALEFYSKENIYFDLEDLENGDTCTYIEMDNGDKARAALVALGEDPDGL